MDEEKALELCYYHNRDNARTPMQWTDEKHAGFTMGMPWLKENPNYKQINVKAQEGNKNSVLNYYRELLALRKSARYQELFTYASCNQKYKEEPRVFSYERELGSQKAQIAANFAKRESPKNRFYLFRKMKAAHTHSTYAAPY